MFHVKQSETNQDTYHKIIDLLFRENQIHNLSGIKEWQGMYDQHIVDSTALAQYISNNHKGNIKVLDLGSGAGFPGLVIALENPDKKVVMVDSNKKKIDFINLVLTELEITNASAIHTRIEDLGCPEDSDIVCAKALTSLDVLMEYSSPLLKTNGLLIAMKSEEIEQELTDALLVVNQLGFKGHKIFPYSHFQKNRQLVVFNKAKKAKIKLPRKNGEAKNKPLRSMICV